MKGTSTTITITDCNHVAKSMNSQLVLESSVVTGGKEFLVMVYGELLKLAWVYTE